MCLVRAHHCSLIGYLNPLLNKVFSIKYNVQRHELGMLGWGVKSLENVFGWSALLFFDWLS